MSDWIERKSKNQSGMINCYVQYLQDKNSVSLLKVMDSREHPMISLKDFYRRAMIIGDKFYFILNTQNTYAINLISRDKCTTINKTRAVQKTFLHCSGFIEEILFIWIRTIDIFSCFIVFNHCSIFIHIKGHHRVAIIIKDTKTISE